MAALGRGSDRLLGLWRRRRPQGADILPSAGVILADLHDRLGRFQALMLIEQEWPGFSSRLVDLAQLAYLDGCADADHEDADGLVDGRERAMRAAACGAVVGSAADEFLCPIATGTLLISGSSYELWSRLGSVFAAAGVTVDDGLAALGAPGLAAVFQELRSVETQGVE